MSVALLRFEREMHKRAVLLLMIVPLIVPLVAYAAARLTADPSSVTFDSRCVRTSARRVPVTVTNDDPRPATDVSVRVLPTRFATVFPLSGATAVPSLAPSEDARFSVGFVPGKAGTHSARARIDYLSHPAPSSSPTPSPSPQARSTSVPLAGDGIDRFIDASPRALNFGDLRVGRAAAERSVTVYDDGDSPLSITSITITGRNAGDFTVSPRRPRTITEATPLRLRVGFTPRGVGARLATLLVSSNACGESTMSIDLAGAGVVQDIVALPSRIDFEPAQIGARETRAVTIANQGGADLRVASIALRGGDASHFRIPVTPTLPRTLPPGGSFGVRVRFVADEPGEWRARLAVESNDPDTKTLSVRLVGTTQAPVPTLLPSETADPGPLPSATISPQAPAGEGLLSAYAEVLAVATLVAGFFLLLVIVRRIRGIPE
jgi:hypothetical protein